MQTTNVTSCLLTSWQTKWKSDMSSKGTQMILTDSGSQTSHLNSSPVRLWIFHRCRWSFGDVCVNVSFFTCKTSRFYASLCKKINIDFINTDCILWNIQFQLVAVGTGCARCDIMGLVIVSAAARATFCVWLISLCCQSVTTRASSSFGGQEVAALPCGVCLQGAFSSCSD